MNKLKSILEWMQYQDNNGSYYAIIDELEEGTITINEIIPALIKTLTQWRKDLYKSNRQKYDAMLNMEIELAAMI